MSENLEVKVGKLEERSDNHDKRIFAIETDNKALNKLATTLDEQMRRSMERDERQTEILDRIDKNLTNLNSRFDHMDKRVSFLEEDKKSIEKRKIDLKYKIAASVFGSVLVAIILAYLGLK